MIDIVKSIKKVFNFIYMFNLIKMIKKHFNVISIVVTNIATCLFSVYYFKIVYWIFLSLFSAWLLCNVMGLFNKIVQKYYFSIFSIFYLFFLSFSIALHKYEKNALELYIGIACIFVGVVGIYDNDKDTRDIASHMLFAGISIIISACVSMFLFC